MVINKEIKISTIVISVLLILGIIPATNFAGFTLPFQYLMIPVLLFTFLGALYNKKNIPKVAKNLFVLWLLIIFEVLFSGIFSPLYNLGNFYFPREIIQYVARFLFFATFIIVFYNYKIEIKNFMYIFAGILSLGMLVGVIQFFNFGSISNLFREIYSFSDTHLNYMMRDNYASKRISGVAHHATANGGIASFTLIIIISLYLFHKKRFFLTSIGVFLVLFNVVVSQARMGYLTVAFSIVVFYFVYNRIYRKGIRSTLLLTALVSIITGTIYWLYQKGNAFITQAVFRWERLEQQIDAGENRVGQIYYALEQLNNPFEYLFGISRGVQNTMTSFYIEVEPVNIFVLYGAIGFILQYSLILILLIYFYKNMTVVKNYPILLAMVVASFVGLLSYQFFSAAYFFFRETYVGLFPWILMGACIGAVERFKKTTFERRN